MITIKKNETELEFLWRVGNAKDNGEITETWDEIAEYINEEFRENYESYRSSSAYRKAYQNSKWFVDAGVLSEKTNIKKDNNLENKIESNITDVALNKDGTISSVKQNVEMTLEQSRNPEFLLEQHGYDSKTWKVYNSKNTLRQVYNRQEDKTIDLYTSYLTVKPIENGEITLAQIKEVFELMASKDNRNVIVKKVENNQNGLMLEVPIQDVHFGKLALVEDSNEPYNYNIAKERFNFVIDYIINKVKNENIEKIIFPVGNDYFHFDNSQKSTTSGTPQDADLSANLIFKYGVECLYENILKLSQIAPVEVFCVSGNHDEVTSYHALYALKLAFNHNENITVQTDTRHRKYIEFGKCLIGFSHGDKEGKRLETIMQIEAIESWGRTLYHEFHLGHLHSEQTRETGGIIIRNLSSFTGSDAWHNKQGYVGSIKKCQCFLWDKENGLDSIIMVNVK